mmetsp:Transcript_115241/g.372799  ORF Transcript_115241/g.372799 Transcript_115241/m.372799 type:complete len:315 (-) Transcript_115241:72-1016(-)
MLESTGLGVRSSLGHLVVEPLRRQQVRAEPLSPVPRPAAAGLLESMHLRNVQLTRQQVDLGVSAKRVHEGRGPAVHEARDDKIGMVRKGLPRREFCGRAPVDGVLGGDPGLEVSDVQEGREVVHDVFVCATGGRAKTKSKRRVRELNVEVEAARQLRLHQVGGNRLLICSVALRPREAVAAEPDGLRAVVIAAGSRIPIGRLLRVDDHAEVVGVVAAIRRGEDLIEAAPAGQGPATERPGEAAEPARLALRQCLHSQRSVQSYQGGSSRGHPAAAASTWRRMHSRRPQPALRPRGLGCLRTIDRECDDPALTVL